MYNRHVLGYCCNAMSSFSLYSFEHNSFQTAETSDTRDFPTVTDTFTVYMCAVQRVLVYVLYIIDPLRMTSCYDTRDAFWLEAAL